MAQTWDPNDPYAYSIGEVTKETVPHPDEPSKTAELYFAKDSEKITRKIFVSFKVKRISEIDNVKEQFRIKFHMYFNWLPTHKEYLTYIKAKEEDTIYEWEPHWYPHLEFMNQIEAIDPYPRWEEYPDEGKFRLQKFKDFFQILNDDPESINIVKNARFIRAKYDIEMVFSEELELQSFPFDCQDLSIIMREESAGVKCLFLPELRGKKFGSIDPRYSVMDEWDMEAARIEFGHTNAGASRGSQVYPMIILRLKMKRRWQIFMWNVVFLMLCIEALAITCFSIDPGTDAGDRLSLAVTLVLTAVAFLYVVKGHLPNVPYLTFLDKYVLSGYLYLIAVMTETAIFADGNWTRKSDVIFMWICLVYLICYQIFFIIYAIKVRKNELNKLLMDSDEIENEVTLSRPALEFDYRKGKRTGDRDRLLTFRAELKHHSAII